MVGDGREEGEGGRDAGRRDGGREEERKGREGGRQAGRDGCLVVSPPTSSLVFLQGG